MNDPNGFMLKRPCQRCQQPFERWVTGRGKMPQYCDACAKIQAAEYVKAWRERHPAKAKEINKVQNDKRKKSPSPVITHPDYFVNGFPASTYQAAVLREMEEGRSDVLVNAVAGSGKTTTLLEALRHAGVPESEILVIAFNKHIAGDLQKKLEDTRITVKTVHSVGNAALIRHLNAKPKLDDRKYGDIAKQWFDRELNERYSWKEQMKLPIRDMSDTLREAVKLVRYNLTEVKSPQAIARMLRHYDLEPDAEFMWMLEGIPWILKQGEDRAADVIDFTDMLYLPYIWNLQMKEMRLVCVDEAQDLNTLQRRLIIRMRAPGGRILWVGDPKQSIMGFAGADVRSFYAIKEEAHAKELPLSICYRCPVSHIERARSLVPHLEPRPGAPEGLIEDIAEEDLLRLAHPQDMILCRRTAPLVEMALRFLKAGRIARVRGKESISKDLMTLIERIEKRTGCTFLTFESGVQQYREMERRRVGDREGGAAQLERLKDNCEALLAVYRNTDAQDMGDFQARVKELFQDAAKAIILSTVHRAKGLEADRVFLLHPNTMPLKWEGQQDWEYEQELNIRYVALTRSKRDMYMVYDPKKFEELMAAKDILDSNVRDWVWDDED